jgi:hypothetical protein
MFWAPLFPIYKILFSRVEITSPGFPAGTTGGFPAQLMHFLSSRLYMHCIHKHFGHIQAVKV